MAKTPAQRPYVQAKPSHAREIWAVVLGLLAVFVFVSEISPDTTGWIGYWFVQVVLSHLFGVARWGLPLFLLFPALSLMFVKVRLRTSLINSFLVFLVFTVGVELVINARVPHLAWPIPLNGGGWIGALGALCFQRLFGYNGAWIVLVGLLWVALIFLFGFSIRSFFSALAKLVSKADTFEDLELSQEEAEKLSKKIKPVEVDAQVKKWVSEQDGKGAATPSPAPPPPPPSEATPDPEPTIPISTPPVKKKVAQPIRPETPDQDSFALPSLDLLETPKPLSGQDSKIMKQKRQENAKILEETLASFQVQAKVVHITPGPSVTRYELQPGAGVKISKITSLNKDIALKLAVADVRIEAPIPGKALIGIEVPNTDIETIVIRHLIDDGDFFSHPSKLLCAMGMTITGESVFMDLAKMPHVLIAGATGSGKSVCVNAIILSILLRCTPDDVKFLMIDPKKVELSLYDGIPHLLAPVVTNPNKAAATLKQWALLEMERRYEEFSRVGVKDLLGYNQWADANAGYPRIPYIVVIIDELADLMMVAAQDVENTICRLAQMSRATGIHLVIATQRPSVNVITGLIKANVPSRISFFLQSQIDSRTILDMPGAEKLLGKGDMLYSPVGSFKPKRLQGIFVSEKEVKQVVNFLKAQGTPEYLEEIISVTPIESEDKKSADNPDQDDLFEAAKEIVLSTQNVSTSYLQRKLRIGYNRAARLMEELQEQGIVTPGERRPRNNE